jgi:hypothetical protein
MRGNGALRRLWGSAPTDLPNAELVTGETFNAGGDVVIVHPDTLVLHFSKSRATPGIYQARWIDRSNPGIISEPIRTLDYGPFSRGLTVYRDPETGQWWMYQHNFESDQQIIAEEIVVRTAFPANPP